MNHKYIMFYLGKIKNLKRKIRVLQYLLELKNDIIIAIIVPENLNTQRNVFNIWKFLAKGLNFWQNLNKF